MLLQFRLYHYGRVANGIDRVLKEVYIIIIYAVTKLDVYKHMY